MMKHLYTKSLFGGLGQMDPIITGHIGLGGTLGVEMAVMDTGEVEEDILITGAAQDLGAVVAEEEMQEHLVAVVAAEVVVVVAEEVVEVDTAVAKIFL
jgi:hypothetical protein